MLYYDRINVSEGIDVKKTSESKECDICHYWYFLDKGFTFLPDVCNGCHDVKIISMNLSDIPTLNIKGADYGCIISGISKFKALELTEQVEKAEHYKL